MGITNVARLLMAVTACAAALAVAGCEPHGRTLKARRCPVTSPAWGNWPSREGFIDEVLYASATARTPRFDYRSGYTIDKLDLVDGLFQMAPACGRRLEAVIIVGPAGVLWTYCVFAILRDERGLRVNYVGMPHARITGKATGRVTDARMLRLYAAIDGSPVLTAGRPALPSPKAPDARDAEFQYDFLAARRRGDALDYRHGKLSLAAGSDPMAVAALEDAIGRIGSGLTVTY